MQNIIKFLYLSIIQISFLTHGSDLIIAVIDNDLDLVKALVETGADLFYINDSGMSPLSESNNLKELEYTTHTIKALSTDQSDKYFGIKQSIMQGFESGDFTLFEKLLFKHLLLEALSQKNNGFDLIYPTYLSDAFNFYKLLQIDSYLQEAFNKQITSQLNDLRAATQANDLKTVEKLLEKNDYLLIDIIENNDIKDMYVLPVDKKIERPIARNKKQQKNFLHAFFKKNIPIITLYLKVNSYEWGKQVIDYKGKQVIDYKLLLSGLSLKTISEYEIVFNEELLDLYDSYIEKNNEQEKKILLEPICFYVDFLNNSINPELLNKLQIDTSLSAEIQKRVLPFVAITNDSDTINILNTQ